MYVVNKKFLYEILDDYKDCVDDNEKDEIISSFMKLIWSSKNKRSVYKKELRFSVSKSLLDTEIGQIFNTYSDIEYVAYRSMSKDTDFISLLRQKINNIYTNLCDGRVCLKKEYMDLINLPKQMYYRWKSGEDYKPDTITFLLDDTIAKSMEVKEKYSKQKMKIEWSEYKVLIVPYFKRMFENYIPLDDFEDKTKITLDVDTWHEDNFSVAYLCKGLDGYMKNYQKEYYGVQRNKTYSYCECGGMFVKNIKNNRFKCVKCSTYQPIETKTIKCIDCDVKIKVYAKDNGTRRCELHRKEHKRELKRLEMQRYRQRKYDM